jgi:hypothetical protein
VSIVPRTKGALGFAQYLPSDQKLYTTEQVCHPETRSSVYMYVYWFVKYQSIVVIHEGYHCVFYFMLFCPLIGSCLIGCA